MSNFLTESINTVVNEWKLPYEGTEEVTLIEDKERYFDLPHHVSRRKLVILKDNQFFCAYYYLHQNSSIHWDRYDFVDFFEVVPVEKTTTVFEQI